MRTKGKDASAIRAVAVYAGLHALAALAGAFCCRDFCSFIRGRTLANCSPG